MVNTYKQVIKMLFGSLITIGFLLVTNLPVFAHKVTVFAWVEGDIVFTQSKFSGGKRVVGGNITVYDDKENILLKGETNNQGEFSFPLLQKPPLVIELNAGMGHMARWRIEPDDVTEIDKASTPPNDQIETQDNRPSPVRYKDTSYENKDELTALIEEILDKKLAPIMKILADSQQKGPSLSDIMGGIGYIIGLVGIVAYFKNRQIKR